MFVVLQMNQATHFLDGSQLYGTSLHRDRSLREYSRGKLLLAQHHGRQYLPPAEEPRDRCQVQSNTGVCYKSGESVRLAALLVLTEPGVTSVSLPFADLYQGWDGDIK